MPITRSIRKKRSKVKITGEYPVVIVYRSNKNISAQLFDPKSDKTVFTVSSNTIGSGTKTEKSIKVGELVGDKLNSLKLTKVVFNRNGYLYHGRIKALADAIRSKNIEM